MFCAAADEIINIDASAGRIMQEPSASGDTNALPHMHLSSVAVDFEFV